MPPSAHTACIEIGGVPISLSTTDPRFFNILLSRYEGFVSASRPEVELEFDIVGPRPASDDDVCVRRDSSTWLIQRGDFRALWNPRTHKGSVRQNSNPYSLDSVLRILHSLILAGRGGFLLHAASAICDGRAYLFSGVSGAGKTTITRLAPPNVTLLTDEVSYVRPAADASSPYSAFGTPFAGELARPGENCSAPVAAIFFLEKGPRHHIDELPSTEAVQRLMRNILFFAEDPVLVDKVFAAACDFITRVPVRRLTFYPDASVWDEVRNFEGALAHA